MKEEKLWDNKKINFFFWDKYEDNNKNFSSNKFCSD